MNRIKALYWKFGHVPGIATRDGEITEWPESLGKKPTKKEWDEIELQYNAEVAKTEYKQKRKIEYPEASEQLEAIWSFIESQRNAGLVLDNESAEMLDRILAIKEKHSKPQL